MRGCRGVIRIILLLLLSTYSKSLAQQPNFKTSVQRLKFRYMNAYIRSNIWWLESNPDNIRPSMAEIAKHGDQVRRALEVCKKVSPELAKRAQYFSPVGVSLLAGRDTLNFSKAGEQPKIFVCFISQDQMKGHPSSLWFDGQKVLMFAADWPIKLLPSLIGHELLAHGYNAKTNGTKTLAAPPNAGVRISEEVQAHTTEGLIMNYVSGGQYFKLIDAYLAKTKPKNWQIAVSSTSLNLLKQLDKMFNAEGCSVTAASLLLDQHLLIIGFRAVDRLPLTALHKSKKKMEAYRDLP